MPLKKQVQYMGSGSKSQTGPITTSIKHAAVKFFEKYPNETKVWVSEGDNYGPIFVALMSSKPFELTREQVLDD